MKATWNYVENPKVKNHGERKYTSEVYHEFNRVMLRLQALRFYSVRVEPLDFWVISCEAIEISDKQL